MQPIRCKTILWHLYDKGYSKQKSSLTRVFWLLDPNIAPVIYIPQVSLGHIVGLCPPAIVTNTHRTNPAAMVTVEWHLSFKQAYFHFANKKLFVVTTQWGNKYNLVPRVSLRERPGNEVIAFGGKKRDPRNEVVTSTVLGKSSSTRKSTRSVSDYYRLIRDSTSTPDHVRTACRHQVTSCYLATSAGSVAALRFPRYPAGKLC